MICLVEKVDMTPGKERKDHSLVYRGICPSEVLHACWPVEQLHIIWRKIAIGVITDRRVDRTVFR